MSKLLPCLFLAVALIGCRKHPTAEMIEANGRYTEPPKPDHGRTVTFLGIPENESSGEGPVGSINGQTCQFDNVSAVSETTYQEYLSAKQAGRVFVEETHGDTVYYAIKEDRDVPFESGGAWFVEIVRLKAKRP